jgi:hypothetical protein
LRRLASLVVRAPMAGAGPNRFAASSRRRLCRRRRCRRHGRDAEVGGGGAPRHVSPALTAHRDTQALLEIRSPEEGGVTATERPGNTEPVGKSGMQPQGETDKVNTNKLRIATLRGNNTDPTGKGEPLDRPQRVVRCRRWWDRYHLTAVFRGKVCAARRRLPITDPTGKEYRPLGWTFTDPTGKEYRSSGVTLPIVAG